MDNGSSEDSQSVLKKKKKKVSKHVPYFLLSKKEQ